MAPVPPRPDLWTLIRLVDDAAADAVRRAGNRSVRWWRTPSGCAGWTRAEVVGHLAGEVARLDAELEGEPVREVPPAPYEPAWAQRLAVVTYDLVLALRARPDETVAAVALNELLVHAHDVDPGRLDDTAAGAVLALLHPARVAELPGGPPAQLLLDLQRGPGEWHREVGGR